MSLSILMRLLVTTGGMSDIAASDVGKPDLRCGAYSLYVGLKGLAFDVGSFESFDSRIGPPSVVGYSMSQLDAAARDFGAHTLAVKTDLEHLARRKQPFACVAHLRTNHFVLISAVDETQVILIDPPRRTTIPRVAFEQLWDGTALLVARGPLESEESLWRFDWQGTSVGRRGRCCHRWCTIGFVLQTIGSPSDCERVTWSDGRVVQCSPS